MKKGFAVIAVCLLAVLLCACGSLNANTGKNGGEEQQGMIKTGEISVAEFDMDKHCVTLNSGYIMQKLGLVMEGWYPLGGRGYNKELMKEPVLQKIADSHGVSLVQVILRWNLQKGVVVIPGSANPDQSITISYIWEVCSCHRIHQRRIRLRKDHQGANGIQHFVRLLNWS